MHVLETPPLFDLDFCRHTASTVQYSQRAYSVFNLLLSFTESDIMISSDELIYVLSNVTNLSLEESHFPRNKIFEQITLVFPFPEMYIYFESTSGELVLPSTRVVLPLTAHEGRRAISGVNNNRSS